MKSKWIILIIIVLTGIGGSPRSQSDKVQPKQAKYDIVDSIRIKIDSIEAIKKQIPEIASNVVEKTNTLKVLIKEQKVQGDLIKTTLNAIRYDRRWIGDVQEVKPKKDSLIIKTEIKPIEE
ncbi:hypothetical protein DYBT9275_02785 [Dyadobacter sp. CECT 9275]|uniref:Uncharacterized protein n=1 Tax=Dyadobacter helix TaxID=2822344 RepID=A0A916JEU5_9BACT|nr:hypothetical protein [Dyadobacter sp. CECT 9275]CAG5002009.1 hypothetical protein DYBT9275_02785 [Dyadobacter sp. CECT 9275]